MNAIQEQGCRNFLKLLATHYNFKIVTGAECPATNRETVYLPDLKNLDPVEVNGYSFHEFLHLAHTDFNVVNYGASIFVRGVFNALEDTRIEMLGVKEYPGGQFVLNGRISALLDKSPSWWSSPDPKKACSYLTSYICLFGKVKFLASPARLTPCLAEGRRLLGGMLGEPLMTRLDQLLLEATPKLSSSRAAYLLARRIERLLREMRDEEEDKDEAHDGADDVGPTSNADTNSAPGASNSSSATPQGNAASSPQQGEGRGSSGKSADEKNQGAAGSATPNDAEAADASSASSSRTSCAGKGEPDASAADEKSSAQAAQTDCPDGQDEADEGGAALREANGEPPASVDASSSEEPSAKSSAAASQQGSRPSASDQRQSIRAALNPQEPQENFLSNGLDGKEPARGRIPKVKTDLLWTAGTHRPAPEKLPKALVRIGREIVAEASPLAERLRLTLNGMLQAQTHAGTYLATSGRTISRTAIGRLAVGSLRVLERRETPRRGLDTAVSVLLDCSGSMGTCALFTSARRIAAALVLALRRIPNCTASLSVFPYDLEPAPAAEIIPPGRTSLSEMEHALLARLCACGITSLKEGLATALSSLECHTESRRLVILITDGEFDALSLFKERALRQGIDIYVLGLQPRVTIPSGIDAITSVATAFKVLTFQDLRPTNMDGNILKSVAEFARSGMFRAK